MTMMELSTIIPNPNINPDNDMMFILIPNIYSSNSEATRERGMVIITSTGERRSLMKRKMTSTARIAPTRILDLRLSIE